MSIVHSYTLTAAPGKADELAAALVALAAAAAQLAGSGGARVLRQQADPEVFVFEETWADAAARNAAGPQLPRAVMGAMMAALGGKPQSALYDVIG